MLPEESRRLNEEESDFVLKRALELQEAAGRLRTPADVFGALQELGVDPAFAEQALAELRERMPAAVPAPGAAPQPRRRRRTLRRVSAIVAGLLVLGGAAASVAALQEDAARETELRRYVSGVAEQLAERQEFYRGQKGEYAGKLEDLGKLQEYSDGAEIELMGGGKGYLAHVQAKYERKWCDVHGEEGKEPQTTCHF